MCRSVPDKKRGAQTERRALNTLFSEEVDLFLQFLDEYAYVITVANGMMYLNGDRQQPYSLQIGNVQINHHRVGAYDFIDKVLEILPAIPFQKIVHIVSFLCRKHNAVQEMVEKAGDFLCAKVANRDAL